MKREATIDCTGCEWFKVFGNHLNWSYNCTCPTYVSAPCDTGRKISSEEYKKMKREGRKVR